MRNCLTILILIVSAMLSCPPLVKAQTAPRNPAAHAARDTNQTPDLSGRWKGPGRQFKGAGERFIPEADDPPMLPWAEEKYKIIRRGVTDPTRQGRIDMDPMMPPHCMLPGMPRAYMRSGNIEIMQSPGRVYVLFESDPAIQRIYTDGRPHPDGAPDSFMGHSIGKWEGDTLVVETVGLNDLTWIDGVGHPHTTELRVEQRFRRIDPTKLEMTMLFHDPKTYQKPWGPKTVYTMLGDDFEMMEYILCEAQQRENLSKSWENDKKVE